MPSSDPAILLQSFQTFGDLLKFLRARARLTQRELSIAVGYSEAQISRLEQNLRPPDLAALLALFIPALYLEEEPKTVARLMELAAQARGEKLPKGGQVTLTRSVQRQITQTTQFVEEDRLTNLPLQLTSFIGRAGELLKIKNLLTRGSSGGVRTRLLTLTGSGGSGKTRLALEAARQLIQEYPDGVWLVELGSILASGLVVQSVTSVLGIPESREGPPIHALTNYLRTKQMLLILDNCEQVLSAAAKLIEETLRACPHVQIMTTSQEILKVPGEVRFQVSSLTLPEDDSIDSRPEAVRLFVERAQAVQPSFTLNSKNVAAVTHICRRLDGMPLGIELAAAQMTTFSVAQIADRLDESFRILAGGRTRLPRHQTLQATIDWSYSLLSQSERILLHRLSIFTGGWTLEAAEIVAGDGSTLTVENILHLLGQLVNKSLVIVDFQADTRYRLLETVRQYAYERLVKSTELNDIETRFFDFYYKFVKGADANLKTAEHQTWLKRLDAEKDNLRAALDYGQAAKRYEDTLWFAGMHFWFWQTVGYIREGRSALASIVTATADSFDPEPPGITAGRAKALWAAGSLAWIQADYTSARSQLEESVRLWRQLGEAHKAGLAIALREMGILATAQGESKYALAALEESIQLMQEASERWNLALAFYNLGLVYETMNDLRTARENFEKSLSQFRELNEPWGLSVAFYGFGRIAGRQADFATARSYLEKSLEFSRKLNDLWSVAGTFYLLGEVEQLQANPEEAFRSYSQSLILNQTVGDIAMIGFTLHNLGKVAHMQGQLERAAQLFGAAKALREDSTNTTSWSLTDHAQCEQDIAVLRAAMGEEAFRLAWAKGCAMSSDEVMEYALN